MARLIQTVNTVDQTVPTNGYLNLGVINRRYCNTTPCGGSVFTYNGTNTLSIDYPGYYDISISLNAISAANPIIINVLIDGVPYTTLNSLAGATAQTIGTNFIARVFNNSDLNLSLQSVSAADITIEDVSVNIVKVA